MIVVAAKAVIERAYIKEDQVEEVAIGNVLGAGMGIAMVEER